MQRQQAGRRLVADAGQGRGAVHEPGVHAREAPADGIHFCTLHSSDFGCALLQGRTGAAQILLSREASIRAAQNACRSLFKV